jgi:hypothetical protein
MYRDKESIRQYVSSKLGCPIDDITWQFVEDDGYVDDVLNAQDNRDLQEALDVLIHETRKLRRYRRAWRGYKAPPGRSPRVQASEDQAVLSEDLKQRAIAFSEYLAKVASFDPRIQNFRKDILGGRLLTEEEAIEFVSSPALRYFSMDRLADKGVPLTGHTAEIIEYKDARPTRTCDLSVKVQVRWGEDSVVILHRQGTFAVKYLRIIRADGSPVSAEVWDGSVLDDARRLAESLTKFYPWDKAQATTWLLTGNVPIVSPLKAQCKIHHMSYGEYGCTFGTITLTVAPWVPASQVLAFYRKQQRKMLRRDNRPLRPKTIALFRFVTEQVDDQGKIPSVRQLLKLWNKRYPEWHYRDERRFWNDVNRAVKLIVHSVPS